MRWGGGGGGCGGLVSWQVPEASWKLWETGGQLGGARSQLEGVGNWWNEEASAMNEMKKGNGDDWRRMLTTN